MPRVDLFGPLLFNQTGYDREPVLLPAGPQEASPRLAAFLRDNCELGEILADEDYSAGHNAPPADAPGRDEWPQLTPMATKALKDAGFDTPAKLREATDEALLDVKGVGQKVLDAVRAHFAAASDAE